MNSVCTTARSLEELAGICGAGRAGKCPAAGPPVIVFHPQSHAVGMGQFVGLRSRRGSLNLTIYLTNPLLRSHSSAPAARATSSREDELKVAQPQTP